MKTNRIVSNLDTRRTMFQIPVLMVAMIALSACGNFHAKDQASGGDSALAQPNVVTPGEGDDGWAQPTPTPSATATPTPRPSPTATPGTGATPTPTPTPTPSATPGATPTATPQPTPAPTPLPWIAANFRVMSMDLNAVPCLRDSAVGDIYTTFGVMKCPIVNDAWSRSQKTRVRAVTAQIQQMVINGTAPDVILLQGAYRAKNDIFDDDAVNEIPTFAGYPYISWGPGSKIDNGFDDYWNLYWGSKRDLRGLLSSGLLILSKHPIKDEWVTSFSDVCSGDDCLINKGALISRIYFAPLNRHIDVINTHLQTLVAPTRGVQVDLVSSFVHDVSKSPIAIFGGDLSARRTDGEILTLSNRLALNHLGNECQTSPVPCAIAPGTDLAMLSGTGSDHVYATTDEYHDFAVTGATTPAWTFSGGFSVSNHLPFIYDMKLFAAP